MMTFIRRYKFIMKAKLIRNATLWIEIAGKTILTDPMFGPKGSLGPFPWISDRRPNPLTDLPFSIEHLKTILPQVDAILLTHLHPDHWDTTAQQLLDKSIPVYLRPEDAAAVESAGFTQVIPVKTKENYEGITIIRTGARHGIGEIGGLMGQVSGFILQHEQETLYIAGDTIWCDEVKTALDTYQPQHIILNGGGATFDIGNHVTMNCSDIQTAVSHYPTGNYHIVHLETVSPVQENREMIRDFLRNTLPGYQVSVPEDGTLMY